MGHPAHFAGVQVPPERTCAEHGVPVKISDPLAIAEIAEILRSGREKRESKR